MNNKDFNKFSKMPNFVLHDKGLSMGSKVLFCEIFSLCAKYGYCFATNKHFAEAHDYSIKGINCLIQELIQRNLIESNVIVERGKTKRYLTVVGYRKSVNI